jgi:hypothetical protein
VLRRRQPRRICVFSDGSENLVWAKAPRARASYRCCATQLPRACCWLCVQGGSVRERRSAHAMAEAPPPAVAVDVDAALRATPYDLAYWQTRYERDGGAFEWYSAASGSPSAEPSPLHEVRLHCCARCCAMRAAPARTQLRAAVLKRAPQVLRGALGGGKRRVLDLGCGTSRCAQHAAMPALLAAHHRQRALDASAHAGWRMSWRRTATP